MALTRLRWWGVAIVGQVRPLLDQGELSELQERLARTRWERGDDGGWATGVPEGWTRELVEDWQRFDVAGLQDRLDALPHLRVDLGGGVVVHAVLVEGRGPAPMPLVLTHGWPGSFLEHLDLIPLLTDPGAHGGDPADAFTVVLPSLPGFGFSGPPPPGGMTSDEVASLWHLLMTDALGYARYGAHGSDLGAGVTARLARARPESVIGAHLATPGLPAPPPPRSAAEASFVADVERWTADEGGYAHQHATRPATLAAGLLDSPVGLAAWVGEKVVAWSSTRENGDPAFDRDLLLSTLTLYWTTRTIGTSLLPYAAERERGAALPADDPARPPAAVTVFGGERVPFPKPPREAVERYVRLTRWAEHDHGGHFPAVAEPQLLVRTLRKVFGPLRSVI